MNQCNNPLTHEPKLARARRLLPEWSEYDSEIAALAKRVSEQSNDGVGSAFEEDVASLEQAKLQEEDKQAHRDGGEESDVGGQVREQTTNSHNRDEL